jgi:hypothetical protein
MITASSDIKEVIGITQGLRSSRQRAAETSQKTLLKKEP